MNAWVARQLRGATPFEVYPRFLVRDNDRKLGPRIDHLAGMRHPIPTDHWAELKAEGLLREDAPIPWRTRSARPRHGWRA